MIPATAPAPISSRHPAESEYDALLATIHNRVASAAGPLFTTDVEGEVLWSAFLAGLPAERRQHYTCHACRRFVQTYGGLVTIDENGHAEPLCWVPGMVGGIMEAPVHGLHRMVREARVTGIFISSDRVLGQPEAGGWRHMAGTLPACAVYTGKALTASQRAAELKEDHGTLCRGLAEFHFDTFNAAVTLLEGDDLYRGNKTLGVGRWLLDLQVRRGALKGPAKNNVTWLAVAKAPAGWCHIKSTMIGTLLEDIEAGKSFTAVAASFKAKMHPLLYQRPQALPAAGTVKQAEDLVEKLGVAASLQRRFARVEEAVALWRPKPAKIPATPSGVFGAVPTRDRPQPSGLPLALQGISPKTITWERFEADVLPTADRIEAYLSEGFEPFYALVTAVDPGAPPVLQWDREEQRNPVSGYTNLNGSHASAWGLKSGWTAVEAVTLFPPQWHDRNAFAHQGSGVLFLLRGAIPTSSGAGMFPEMLRSEFHGIRSVIEQHQVGAAVADGQPAAVGLGMRAGSTGRGFRVQVVSGNVLREYTIDRWR